MKKKLVMLIAVFGLLGIVVGCGNTENASEKKVEKEKSEDVFANGDSFKMRDSDNLSYYFELTSTEPNVLTVYDLENNRREYRIAYNIEKMNNGNVIYKFEGDEINGHLTFTGLYGENTEEYHIIEIDDNYFFIPINHAEGLDLSEKESIDKIKKNYLDVFSYEVMDKI